MRELLPAAAKWSPFEVVEARSFSIIEPKTSLTDEIREWFGRKFLRMKTPGPERRMWFHSSWSMSIVVASEAE